MVPRRFAGNLVEVPRIFVVRVPGLHRPGDFLGVEPISNSPGGISANRMSRELLLLREAQVMAPVPQLVQLGQLFVERRDRQRQRDGGPPHDLQVDLGDDFADPLFHLAPEQAGGAPSSSPVRTRPGHAAGADRARTWAAAPRVPTRRRPVEPAARRPWAARGSPKRQSCEGGVAALGQRQAVFPVAHEEAQVPTRGKIRRRVVGSRLERLLASWYFSTVEARSLIRLLTAANDLSRSLSRLRCGSPARTCPLSFWTRSCLLCSAARSMRVKACCTTACCGVPWRVPLSISTTARAFISRRLLAA